MTSSSLETPPMSPGRCLPPMVWAVLSTAAFAAPPAPVAGPSVVERGGFYEYRSRNYRIKTDVDARFAVELGAFMDEVDRTFNELFPGEPQVGVVPTVVV